MAKPQLTEEAGSQPEVRLELTNAEGRQVWALYSERPHALPPTQAPPVGQFVEELLSIAWRWRRRIALGALAGAVLGVVYVLAVPSVYIVRALVHIEQRDSVLQQYDTVRAGSTFIATQAEILHSPNIVSSTFDALGSSVETPEPGIFTQPKAWLRSLNPLSDGAGPPPDPRAAAVASALAALDATPVVGTDVMAITFRTAEPQAGVAFLDALIDRYRAYVRDLEIAAHSEGLDLLRKQDRELGSELEGLQARWEELHASTLALGQDENALSIQKMRLEEHARASVAAGGRRIELENRLAFLEKNGGGAVPGQDSELLEKLRAAEASMAELRASVSDRHPDVRKMEYQIEALREQIERDSVMHLAGLKGELRAARRTEQMLSGLYDKEWAAAKELEVQGLREVQVRQESERVEQKRDAVLALLRDKELRVLSLQSGRSGTVVRVLDPPTVPMERVWPRPGMVLAGFGFVGALAGLGLAVLGERRLPASGVWTR
jgi:uncharacterized protein involved in exopolysaccharide biosynthesis